MEPNARLEARACVFAVLIAERQVANVELMNDERFRKWLSAIR